MPMPDNDKVSLLVGGKVHAEWENYEIDSDLLTPADAWQVSLGMSGMDIPDGVAEGDDVVVKVGSDTVLTGYIDDIDEPVDKNGHTFTLTGRDRAADLLDGDCPIFSKQEASLKQIVAAIVHEFGIVNYKIKADTTRIRKKIAVDPGVSAWDALVHAAEANGLWPWFEPDGTLVVGGPDYSSPEVATLILRKDGQGNNVLSLHRKKSMAERYSKVTVYSQAPGSNSGGMDFAANHAASGYATDPGVRNRPHIVIDNECETNAACTARARKLIADARLKGFTLTAIVKGHRIVAPGQPSDGQLWKPMQRIRVISIPHKLDAVYFLMARKFKRNRREGTITVLTLKEDAMWVLDAHPHSRHARGKNSLFGAMK